MPSHRPGGLLIPLILAACVSWVTQASRDDTATRTADSALCDGSGAGAASRSLLAAAAAAAPGPALPYAQDNLPLNTIKLPPGFRISLYVNASMQARFMQVGNRGRQRPSVVYISSTSGPVWAIVDRGGGAAPTACTLLQGLEVPNGLAYDNSTGSLFVAEKTRIVRYDNVDAAALANCRGGLLTSQQVVGPQVLPDQRSHSNRALGLGPDGKLYVSIGAPFNVDVCRDPYCSIWRMNKDGSRPEVFARGIRNAAWVDWHPGTGALVFSGMERDMMGNDRPDDVMGVVYPNQAGINLTWPYCHWLGGGPPELRRPGPGSALPDPDLTPPEFPQRPADSVLAQRCKEVAAPPLQALGPHVAPLGLLYWPPPSLRPSAGVQRWPARYGNGFFSGQHGSWNRDDKIGYRVAHVQLSDDGRKAVAHTVFAQGWLRPDGTAWGRPTGLARLPDGSLLVADNRANVVYRISYTPPSPPPRPPPPPPVPRLSPPPPRSRPPPPPAVPRLAQGTYTLKLMGRNGCPVRGYATAQPCKGTRVTLAFRPNSAARLHYWSVVLSRPGFTIVGAPVRLQAVGRTACRTATAFLTAAATCATSGVSLGGTATAAGASWTLQQGPRGAYYITSRLCDGGKFLGVPIGCGATALGLYPKGTATALLWQLAAVT